MACVRPGWEETAVEVYPIPPREPLPAIAMPLREGETDAPLDLQLAVDHLYQSGRYDGWLDYSKPPLPPLDPADEAWADNLLRTAGRR